MSHLDKKNEDPVILFDGYCNLCNNTVQWVIRHDKEEKFLFAPLTSYFAKEHLPGKILEIVDSLILIEGGEVFIKSTAALKIANKIGGWYNLLYALIIIPPFLRNMVYDFIAKYRYRWFGKRNECMVPTPELRERFLD